MNLTFKTRVLLSQYVVVFFFVVFSILIYANIKDTNDNKVHFARESFTQYRLASQSQYDIAQIQQFLSGVSASKAQDGLSDGFKKAEIAYNDLLANLEQLKKEASKRNNQELTLQVEEIIPLANDYYYTAVEMANTYVSSGTTDGNEFMLTLNEVSSILQEKTSALFKKSNENFLSNMDQIGQSTSLIKLLSIWGPVFVLLLTSILIFLFAKKMDKSLRDVVSGLVENSSDLEGASISLYENSQQLFESVEKESREMDLTSSAVHEISAMVDSNAEYSSKAKDATVKTVEVTEKGIKTLENVLHAIEELSTSNSQMVRDMENFNNDVGSMINVISEIDDKTKIINDIVFQTKLLSFNASVEAARAGEAGKGFAVVAEEIGNLAAMSGTAAKDIAEMLAKSVATVSNIMKESQTRIGHISQSASEQVKSSKAVVDEANRAMASILENITVVEEMNKEIVVASNEQSTGVRDVNKSLSNIAVSIKNNHEVAEESAEQSKVLTTQAEKLSEVISHFLTFVEGEKRGGFNFKSAISAHLGWRSNLNNYLLNPDGHLKEEVVCKDDQCQLGKWLYGDGVIYQKNHGEVYSQLVESHAEFHRAVGHIVGLIHNGDKESAVNELRPKSNYMLASKRTVAIIKQMQKEVG